MRILPAETSPSLRQVADPATTVGMPVAALLLKSPPGSESVTPQRLGIILCCTVAEHDTTPGTKDTSSAGNSITEAENSVTEKGIEAVEQGDSAYASFYC